MTSTMASLEDARQRFFTEGTLEARWAYQAEVARVIREGHEEIELDCGLDARGCGGWYSYDGPCGGCVDCLHGQWSYAMQEYRVESEVGWRTS
jgi:hypothetical protein